jgi:hypothetical protein
MQDAPPSRQRTPSPITAAHARVACEPKVFGAIFSSALALIRARVGSRHRGQAPACGLEYDASAHGPARG